MEIGKILEFKKQFNGGFIGDLVHTILDRTVYKKKQRTKQEILDIIFKSKLAEKLEETERVFEDLNKNVYKISKSSKDYRLTLTNVSKINLEDSKDGNKEARYELRLLKP